MKIEFAKKLPNEGAMVFIVKEGGFIAAHPFFKLLDEADKKYIGIVVEGLNASSSKFLVLPSGRKSLVLGVASRGKFNARKAILAARRVMSSARAEKIKIISVLLDDFRARTSPQDTAFMIALQAEMANFEFVQYKTPPKGGWSFAEKLFVLSKSNLQSVKRALEAGRVLGEEVNASRALSNTPGGDMTPQKLAEAASYAGRSFGFKTSVFDEKKISELGMGGILGVSKGSSEKPRFIVMEYFKGKKDEAPVVLVGKGVTFDTGGLNLKPEQGIYEMHMDMSGGAAVIHTMSVLARLKAKKNIIGLVPAVENMPSGSSYHPGDVLRTMNGKTIEVLNTDAEGRIILADALEYAKRFSPRLVIDVATLTGAALVALGQRASAMFSTDQKIEKMLRTAGEETGDFVWPLPLWEEYESDVKGTFGDVANVGKNRYGGAIDGAVFLRQFVRNADGEDVYPWVHLDIAPRMTTVEGEFLAKGAAGASVALLARFLQQF